MANKILPDMTAHLGQYNDELDDLIFNLSEIFDWHPIDSPSIPCFSTLEKLIKSVDKKIPFKVVYKVLSK